MLFLGKLALAIFAGAVPVATVVTISSLTKSTPTIMDSSKETINLNDVEKLATKGECFIIDIVKTNEKEIQFLTCTNREYYLYSESSFNKVTKIQGPKKDKQITITLENQAEPKVLTLSDNKWASFPENINIQRSCSFVRVEGTKPALFCTQSSNRNWAETINLAVFNYSKIN